VVTDEDGRAPRGSPGGAVHVCVLVVQCLCVCSGSALLGDLLAVNRSVECEILAVLSYPRFFLSVFIVPYRLLLGISYCVVIYCSFAFCVRLC